MMMLARSSFMIGRGLAGRSLAARPARFTTSLAPRATKGEGKPETNTVGKGKLCKHLAEECKITEKVAGDFLDALFDDIMLSVAEGKTVTIQGFGSFKKRTRAARTGRNPSTGETMQIAEKDAPAFSAGSVFKGVVQTGSWEGYDAMVEKQKAAAAAKKKAKA